LFVDTTRALTGNNLEALQWNLHLCWIIDTYV
jgi:hypothetical protein